MKKEAKKKIFLTFIILSIIGLALSMYLLYEHYQPVEEGALCDFGETVSCSLVNTSEYSKLFNVPVALFGGIWFLVFVFMSLSALKGKELSRTFLAWNIVGVLSIIYLVIAEILLKSICPFCTAVHIIIWPHL